MQTGKPTVSILVSTFSGGTIRKGELWFRQPQAAGSCAREITEESKLNQQSETTPNNLYKLMAGILQEQVIMQLT